MANIPVEKESGSSAWLWILGLIVLALIVWGLWAWVADDDAEVAADGETEVVEPGGNAGQPIGGAADTTGGAGGVITDLSTLTSATGRSVIGRRVQLSNLRVTQMLGDSLFNVTSAGTDAGADAGADTGTDAGAGGGSAQGGVLVILDETTQVEQGGVEGRYNVSEGQRLTVLEGNVEQLDAGVLEEKGLTGPDADQVMQENEFYLRATRLNITAEGG